ncbi:MAG: hypothetical protein V7638_428 [Acidobacteriota bacterium]|jgi:hypothetical protein
MYYRNAKEISSKLAALLIVLLLVTSAVMAQTPSSPTDSSSSPSAGFSFSVRPGTKAWAELKSHDEMLAATQLPVPELRKMTTEGLLETVLTYPLLKDMLAYNSTQTGFEAVSKKFNGLSELRSRKDIGGAALSRYRTKRGESQQSTKERASLEMQGNRNFDLSFLEILMAQDEVRATLNKSQIEELRTELRETAKLKRASLDVYGYEGLESTAFAAAKLLTADNVQFSTSVSTNYSLQQFVAQGTADSTAVIDWILDCLENQPSTGPLSLIQPLDYSSSVSTPNGTFVPATVKTYELSSSQIASYNAYVANAYPLAVRETNSSRRYNCHSYAWNNQSTSNTIWIDTPSDDIYWNDGSYLRMSSGVANRRVSYPASKDHSAIAVNSTQFRSKWGQLPRMLHNYNYCPYWSSGITLNHYSSYTFSTSPVTITLSRGSTAVFNIYTDTTSGFRGTVSFYAIGLPGNQVLPGTGFYSQSVSVQTDNVWYVSSFKFYTNSATPRGSFSIRIEGRSGTKTVVKYINLNIL